MLLAVFRPKALWECGPLLCTLPASASAVSMTQIYRDHWNHCISVIQTMIRGRSLTLPLVAPASSPNATRICPGFSWLLALPFRSFIASDHWYHGLPVRRRPIFPLLEERAGVRADAPVPVGTIYISQSIACVIMKRAK